MIAEVWVVAARIAGRPVPLDVAVQEGARILKSAARCPLIAGLAADVAGVSAGIELARELRGVADHCEFAALLRDLGVMRRRGWIITTPLEARARSDVVVRPARRGRTQRANRTSWRICCSRKNSVSPVSGRQRARFDRTAHIVANETVRAKHRRAGKVGQCAEALARAHYAVVAWSAAQLNEPAIEMLCGLIEALNAKSQRRDCRCRHLPMRWARRRFPPG